MVAAYMGYEPPAPDEEPEAPQADAGDAPARPIALPGIATIPASDAFKQAATTSESLAALERMHFGELIDVKHL